MAGGKLFHQLTTDMEMEPPATKKRRVATGVERPKGVASQFRHTDVSDVEEISKMFDGKEFCVVNGTSRLSKADAERRIAEVSISFLSCLTFSNLATGQSVLVWPHLSNYTL